MKLEWSEELRRVRPQDRPRKLKTTVPEIDEPIGPGDSEASRELMEYARQQWWVIRNVCDSCSGAFFTHIEQERGEEALNDVYRSIVSSHYQSRYDIVMDGDTETQLELTVDRLRGRLTRFCRLWKVDEGKRWRIYMGPLRPGEMVTKRLRSGGKPNSGHFGFGERAHEWIWGKEILRLYSGQCTVANGNSTIASYGHQLCASGYRVGVDRRWTRYKGSTHIRAEYYEREGKAPPPSAPNLPDEPSTGDGT